MEGFYFEGIDMSPVGQILFYLMIYNELYILRPINSFGIRLLTM